MQIRKTDYSELTDYDKVFEIVFADLGIDRKNVSEEEINKIINIVEEVEKRMCILSQSKNNTRYNICYRK